jgi:hypothetical protein
VRDDDILIILEDDIQIVVPNITEVITNEIKNMKEDHIFLGWCIDSRYVPLCTHAYAINRRVARALVSTVDVCSDQAVDIQIDYTIRENHFSWRRSLLVPEIPRGKYKGKGIFVQRKDLPSFNKKI